MRYTKPTILNETKAASQIMGTTQKLGVRIDSNHLLGPKTVVSAYEADE